MGYVIEWKAIDIDSSVLMMLNDAETADFKSYYVCSLNSIRFVSAATLKIVLTVWQDLMLFQTILKLTFVLSKGNYVLSAEKCVMNITLCVMNRSNSNINSAKHLSGKVMVMNTSHFKI